jgi:hypothetical protein
MKPDLAIASHESGHAVAAYLLNVPIVKLTVGQHGLGGTMRTAGGSLERSFDHAIVQLAGGIYMRSLGVDDEGGDDNDFARAVALVEMAVDGRREAAREAFDVVLEATHALVESDEFQGLAAKLALELVRGGYWHSGA